MIFGFSKMRVVATRYNDNPAAASRPFDRRPRRLRARRGRVDGGARARGPRPRARRAGLRDGRRLRLDLRRLPPRADESRRRADRPRHAPGDRAIRARPSRRSATSTTTAPRRSSTTRSRRAASASCSATGRDASPGSSTKSMIGHPQGASGASGIVTTALALVNGYLPPTINLEHPDPELRSSRSAARRRPPGRARRRAVQLPRLRLEEQRHRAGTRRRSSQLSASRRGS